MILYDSILFKFALSESLCYFPAYLSWIIENIPFVKLKKSI